MRHSTGRRGHDYSMMLQCCVIFGSDPAVIHRTGSGRIRAVTVAEQAADGGVTAPRRILALLSRTPRKPFRYVGSETRGSRDVLERVGQFVI